MSSAESVASMLLRGHGCTVHAAHCAPRMLRFPSMQRILAKPTHAMARSPRRRYLTQPDYARPALQIPPAHRERIIAKLTVLYGELDAKAYYWEVERLIQVHHAHKPVEMLRDEAEFDARDRFTQEDVGAMTYGDVIDSPKTQAREGL